MSKSTKNISFVGFTKSKNLVVQECYSLKTRGFHARLFFVIAYLRGILSRNYRKCCIFENIVLNLLQTITRHISVTILPTILLFYI